MTQHQFAPAIFVACLLAFAGPANAGIVKCIDKAGAVTFTDVPCNADANTVHVSDPIGIAPAGIKPAGSLAAAEESRAAPWTAKSATRHRSLAIDVETLKAAKAAMVSTDHASALVRQQALARL